MLRSSVTCLFALTMVITPIASDARDGDEAARVIPLPSPRKGLGFSLGWDADVYDNLHGGAKRGSATDSVLSFGFDLDTEELGAWPGGEFVVGLQAIASTHPSEYAGDLQTLSNIDAPNQRHVAEAWYSQVFGEAALLRAGVMDINSYFDVNETAAFFLNSSFGIAPTLPSNVPTATYPDSAWALMGRVGAEKNGWLLGAFQANPEDRSTALDGGAMLVVERGWSTRDTSGTRIGVGAWYRNAPLEAGPPENDWGAYANVERPFTNHPGTTAFLQFAMSPDDVNEVPAYLGGGVVLHEVSAAVSDVGFSFARAWIRNEDAETSIEATVSLPLLDAKLNLQPDIQYIVHPSGTLPDAFVAGVRLSLSLY